MVMDAALTNAFKASGPGNATGEREDLSDVIARIDPSEVPIYSNMRKGSCNAINTEWLVQELAAVDTANKQPEGFEASFDAVTPTVRFNNYTQILARTAVVSGTMDSVNKAGRNREIAYQRVLKGLEIRRDLDAIISGDFAADGVDPRGLASMKSWITNGSLGATGTFPTGDGTDLGTAGTPRAFNDVAFIDTSMQEAYEDGGNPRIMYMSPAQKVAFSKIPSASIAENRFNMTSVGEAKFIGSADIYLSDFGKLEVAVDRFMPVDRVYLVDPQYFECCTLPGRNFQTSPLSDTGDSEKHLVLWEGTIKASAPKAHAIIDDLS
ncbi:MAG: SU10 major capsid protein [Pseudomonadales bacterium]